MPTKTEYEISNPRKVYVESEEVFNQMKEQGLLQPFTDYYTPDEDGNVFQLKLDLVWQNSDSTLSFPSQTLYLNLKKYDMVLVFFRWTTEHPYTGSTIIQKGMAGYVGAPFNSGSRFQRLIYTVYDDSIGFGDGILGTSVDNTKCIPHSIYGILKTPAMIYTGNELKAGNGIDIEDGEISTTKWKTFNGTAGSENYLPINWNELSEICFRVLGSDQATFGYVHIPKELWHNNGAYILEVNCINEYGNFKGAMWFEVIGKHETSTQIKATVKGSAQTGFMIAYR